MKSYYFGPQSSRLFGVYDPPSTSADRDLGVVICHPFGAEYLRAHRALRQLALRLAGVGFHVLRFDYRGTGDSAGTLEDASVEGWEADALAALESLKAAAGVSQIALVGMRLGAAIACLAARSRRDVRSLVLWEPIRDGPSYLDELWAAHLSWLDYRPWLSSRAVRRDDDTWDVVGVRIGAALRRSISGISLERFARPLADRALVIGGDPRASAEGADKLKRAKVATVVEEATCPVSVWREEDDAQGIVPVTTLRHAVSWLGADGA